LSLIRYRKNRYLKCRYDTDTNISISAIHRRYFRYIDPPLLHITWTCSSISSRICTERHHKLFASTCFKHTISLADHQQRHMFKTPTHSDTAAQTAHHTRSHGNHRTSTSLSSSCTSGFLLPTRGKTHSTIALVGHYHHRSSAAAAASDAQKTKHYVGAYTAAANATWKIT